MRPCFNMIERFKNIFNGLQRAHGCTYVEKKNIDGTKIKGKSFVKREPVTDLLWQNHTKGIEPSLGIIPINEENKCCWGCIDIDSYAGFDHKKLINKINLLNLPLITIRSKSGGAHVFLFTTIAVEAKVLRNKLLSISAVLGFGSSEVFPKQIELKSEEDTGNFLNLPYFNSENTTRYAFNTEGNAINIDSFFELYDKKKVTPNELEKLTIKRPPSEFSDGPPCIESLTQEKLTDGRDRVLYQYIQYAKRKWPEEWQKYINAFNYKYFDPPLEDRIIQEKIKYNLNRELGFKCNEEPMCLHCDKALCKTRKFGIGGEVVFPMLTDLQKVELDEPYYRLNIDGERVQLEKALILYDQRLFQISVLEQLNIILPSLSKKDWRMLIQKLLDNIELIKAPKGSSKVDQLQGHLEEFCTNRNSASTKKEDIMRGNVFQENKKYYFVFSKFYHGFLQKKRWEEKSQPTHQMLREYFKCEEDRIMIGKKKIAVIIASSLERLETPYTPKELKPKDHF